MRSRFCLLLIACVLVWEGAAQAEMIKIATDQNMWYPYSYAEDGVSKGLHIDIVNLVLNNLGYAFSFTPLPWQRCLESAKTGVFDAIIGASFKPERSGYLFYPPGAATNAKSRFRITQVEYSIVTHVDAPYEFNGDVKTLPEPVRAPRGYSVVDDLKKDNIAVEETPGDVNSFYMLGRDKKGCIVTLSQIAVMLMQQKVFSGKLVVSRKPFISKSYFLVFSHKGSLGADKRKEIWNEVVKIRKNDALMKTLLRQY